MSAFAWEGFLRLADNLLTVHERPLRDAALRSAVSRAYYAAFNEARRRLQAEGESLATDGSAHGQVIRTFCAGDAAHYAIGKHLARLRDDRREADYEEFSTVTANASEAVEQARTVLRLLRALP